MAWLYAQEEGQEEEEEGGKEDLGEEDGGESDLEGNSYMLEAVLQVNAYRNSFAVRTHLFNGRGRRERRCGFDSKHQSTKAPELRAELQGYLAHKNHTHP